MLVSLDWKDERRQAAGNSTSRGTLSYRTRLAPIGGMGSCARSGDVPFRPRLRPAASDRAIRCSFRGLWMSARRACRSFRPPSANVTNVVDAARLTARAASPTRWRAAITRQVLMDWRTKACCSFPLARQPRGTGGHRCASELEKVTPTSVSTCSPPGLDQSWSSAEHEQRGRPPHREN